MLLLLVRFVHACLHNGMMSNWNAGLRGVVAIAIVLVIAIVSICYHDYSSLQAYTSDLHPRSMCFRLPLPPQPDPMSRFLTALVRGITTS